MDTHTTPTQRLDTRVLLSTLWIVVMFNLLKADILSLFIPGAAEEAAKTAAQIGVTAPQLMLGAAVMGELAIVMIILSRVSKRGISRWANIVMGIVTMAYIWGGAAAFPHYTFIAIVETICLALIVWFAWTWRKGEA